MRITPLDIQQKGFTRRLRGYDRDEVEAFLSLVASAVEDLIRENTALREDGQRKDEVIADHRSRERALQETLVTAQRASEEIRESARREAEITLSEAELQAERIVAGAHQRYLRVVDDIQEAKRQRIQFESGLRALVEGHRQLLDAFREADDGEAVEFLQGRKKGSPEG
jgi:cell division initiation protein